MREIGTSWDRDNRNTINENFRESKNRVDNLILNTPQPSEVVDIRVDEEGNLHTTAKERIDAEASKRKAKDDELTAQLAQKATKEELANIGDASPKGTYATLTDLQTAYPTGTTGIYIILSDDNWYYWNGTAWTSGGIYQAKGIGDNSIKPFHLSPETLKLLDYYELSANVFDKNDPDVMQGYYIRDGNLIANSNYYTSHKIFVNEGEIWSVRYAEKYTGCFFDNNDNFIGNFGIESGTVSPYNFTIPANAYYMFVNGRMASIDVDMIVKSSKYPNAYIPYEKKMSNDIRLNSNQINQISTNPLHGKIASFNGDSIMRGAGFEGGFAKIISERNNMTYENIAVSGGTITAETYQSDGTTPRNWICRTIGSMRSDADYIILEGGVNDASLDVQIGTITPDFGSALDDTTFIGALESTFKQAILRFPGKKIGFVIVHRIWRDGHAHQWHTLYYPAIKQACEKWGIPYCDLYAQVPSLNLISELKTAYTANDDGWHPNEAGYRQYYVDKIESWMKTL